MESSVNNSDMYRNSSSRRYGINIAASNFLQAPLTALLEYSGILGSSPSSHETEVLINGGGVPSPPVLRDDFQNQADDSSGEEVSIMIIGAGENEHFREANGSQNGRIAPPSARSGSSAVGSDASEGVGGHEGEVEDGVSTPSLPDLVSGNGSADGESENGAGVSSNRDSSYQRYDIQHFARWIEQILPFSLLLLLVFIRQHLQGFSVTIWIAAVLFKSNEILRKQTALKEERKISTLMGITAVFMLHVICVYWWFQNDDLLYPLVLLPPKEIPPFWHAIFIILVNDIMARQAAMAFKCVLLMYYKNSRGRDYRKQGQILTLIEYLLLLYRALLPAPVWYRFFLNKEYGSLFSSLTTGLYLTFKLTSIVEKVQLFITALRALSRKEVHYGSHATSEQVNTAGDLCAICQEKMHAPILLRCKHIFCEDCVSEWFERERTCPLCRALVKPADIRSYGDGSTSLFVQLF